MSRKSVERGRLAEDAAAAFLQRKGCSIIARNWRTRHCEIDIVAVRDAIVYFCEVKLRSTNKQGHGLDYITPRKLAQMTFAADYWLARTGWSGECQLCAIEVDGTYRVTAIVTI